MGREILTEEQGARNETECDCNERGVAGVGMLCSGTFAADAALPQTPEAVIQTMKKLGKPGPDHAKLKPLAGSWDYTAKFWLDPSQPPLTSKGTLERKLILGGRFLEERAQGVGFDGEPGFEHFGLVGYDTAQKKFTSNWACSMGTGTCTGVGFGRFDRETVFVSNRSLLPAV